MAATGGGHYSKFYPHFAAFRHNIRRWRHPGGALLGINILSVFGNPDSIDRDVRTVKEAKVPTDETGWDRLRLMFTYDEYGEMSPELSMVIDALTLPRDNLFLSAPLAITCFLLSSVQRQLCTWGVVCTRNADFSFFC